MSRHVGRKERWHQEDARRWASDLGSVVFERGAWYAQLRYRVLVPPEREHELPTYAEHEQRLGPFKRPRNAMVALEREVTHLRNRHKENVHFGDGLTPP